MERAPPNMVTTTFLCFLTFVGLHFQPVQLKSLCPSEFRYHCKCGPTKSNEQSRNVYVTNCTNMKTDDVQVLQELPIDTEILILVGNDFNRLPENVFGKSANYTKLHEIDLSRNKIRTIDAGAFSEREPKVRKLILNDNKWIPKDGVDIFYNFFGLQELYLCNAFSGHSRINLISTMISASEKSLVSLQVLDISDNGLTDFENDDFLCALQRLRILNLSKNKFTQITLTSRCLPSLSSLDLSQNQIVTLNQESMLLIDSLIDTRFDLSNNPFRCDCDSVNMIIWWQNTSAELLAPVRCSESKPWTNNYLDMIDVNQIECDETRPSVGTVVLIIVLLILVALIIGLLIVNRTTVRKYLVNTTQPIRGKFQYSVINGRQENSEVDV